MEFTIDRDIASAAISLASRAIANRAPRPLMEMLFIRAEDGRVEFRGTNSILDITTWVDADIKKSGSLCVNRIVGDMLPSFKSGDVVFKSDKMLVLKQGRSSNKFAIADSEEFPAKPKVASPFSEIDKGPFLRALEVASIALSDRADMPATQGFHLNPHTHVISAADGDQVIYYQGIAMQGNIAVPAGSYLGEVINTLKSAEKLEVAIGSSWVGFKSKDWEIYVSEKQGNFPDLGSIIERANSVSPSLVLRAPVDELKRLIGKAVMLSDAALASGRLHCLAIDRDGADVRLQMNAQDISSLDEVLEGAEAEGKDRYRILVHPRLLSELISVTKSDKLIFKFYRPTDPFIVEDPNENYQYIQVAMKLDREAEMLNEEEVPKKEELEPVEVVAEQKRELELESEQLELDLKTVEEVSDF